MPQCRVATSTERGEEGGQERRQQSLAFLSLPRFFKSSLPNCNGGRRGRWYFPSHIEALSLSRRHRDPPPLYRPFALPPLFLPPCRQADSPRKGHFLLPSTVNIADKAQLGARSRFDNDRDEQGGTENETEKTHKSSFPLCLPQFFFSPYVPLLLTTLYLAFTFFSVSVFPCS